MSNYQHQPYRIHVRSDLTSARFRQSLVNGAIPTSVVAPRPIGGQVIPDPQVAAARLLQQVQRGGRPVSSKHFKKNRHVKEPLISSHPSAIATLREKFHGDSKNKVVQGY